MKNFTRNVVAVLLATSALLFVSQSANAMPCDGPGCTGESTTGYPGGVAPDSGTGDGSGQTVAYDCEAKHPVEIVTTIDGKGVSEVTTRFLTEVEVLEICKPKPGDKEIVVDLPITDTSAVAVPETATPPAPLAQVGATVPATSTEAPKELAYTGFNWGVFSAAVLALGTGFGLLRMNRKLA